MSDQTRDGTASRFATSVGWHKCETMTFRPFGRASDPAPPHGIGFIVHREMKDEMVHLPDHDAPLHEHLAFVGRVAEALGAEGFTIDSNPARVWFRVGAAIGDGKPGEDGDLSEAAMLAAIAAKGAR